jgi:type I restriction enzyme R subunit
MPRSTPSLPHTVICAPTNLNFLRAVKAAVLRHGRITRAALSEPPLSRVGRVETLFPPQDIDELINLANQLLDEAA